MEEGHARLSAGRVQSVATRLLVERERARMRFLAAAYWDLDGICQGRVQRKGSRDEPFGAALVALDGRRLVTGRDFGEAGQVSADVTWSASTRSRARGLADRLGTASSPSARSRSGRGGGRRMPRS